MKGRVPGLVLQVYPYAAWQQLSSLDSDVPALSESAVPIEQGRSQPDWDLGEEDGEGDNHEETR